ncbi:Eftud2 protein [Culex quinquefasciatus]|uniref:Eftud2 protein n=1 Tax=Culex quinquefasciatus TaxID=7176 RepID=B0WEU1_CULQU|nr:Eftud2 protein [Culex quinquefasciatus]|eukprot:XP_001847225.1 Eftud2 protein [Culex quinquefasciatus]
MLASRAIWAFSQYSSSPHILVDDKLSFEADKTLLCSVKDSIVQGFQSSRLFRLPHGHTPPHGTVSLRLSASLRRLRFLREHRPCPATCPRHPGCARLRFPAIDSFGFDTDLRTHTQGLAFCLSVFHYWQIVPGDPLGKSIAIRPLERNRYSNHPNR